MHTFEITIQRRDGDHWPVIVEGHAGDGAMPVRVESRLALDRHGLLGLDADRAAYGEALGRALFSEPIRDAFVAALARAPERLRVLLFVEDRGMRGLRWERLRAPVDGGWRALATFQRAPLTRYLPSLTDRRFLPMGRRDLRALILAASPGDLARFGLGAFDAAAAVASTRSALGDVPALVLADIPGADGRPTLDGLCVALTAAPIGVLHIVAHGRVLQDGESVIYLSGEDGPGSVDPVTCTRLVERLSALQGARGLPHFTFLATCESASPDADEALGGLGQRLVVELGMPAVVAMAEKVSVATAHALSAELYRRLREHGEPDRALVEATAGLAERGDVTVPALFSRLGGRPLFSDMADRPLAQDELELGLERLAALLPQRAPVLAAELQLAADTLRKTGRLAGGALSEEARGERRAALERAAAICAEAADMSLGALATGEPPPPYDARCPFPGLRAFSQERIDFFFGREALVARLADRLAADPFLAVMGPSGSGKSSAVFAGLVPELRRRHRDIPLVSLTPGELPLASLLYSLETSGIAHGGAGPRALIVVDQFEEIFTLCSDLDERRIFVQELLALAGPHLVVITMRADFWGEVAPHHQLRERVQSCQELVPPLAPEELRRAIELQAAAVGLRFEAGLGEAILDDVRGEPGAMPLLQHALQELWQRRRGRWLRSEEYRAIGGVQRAIAHTADAIYLRCTAEEQARLRAIFLRLTRLDREGGEERRDTRQRVTRGELVPAGAEEGPTQALVGRLADARLVVTSGPGGGDMVEVAHEALIRCWPRLRTWLTEDRQTLLLRESVQGAARDWDTSGRDESFLFRGARLDEGLALLGQQRFGLNAVESAFLEAGRSLREREQGEREAARLRDLETARVLAETEARRAREAQEAAARLRRNARVLKSVAVGALALMILALAAGAAAISGHSAARLEAARANLARGDAEKARDDAEEARDMALLARAEAERSRGDAEAARDEAAATARSAAQRALVADAQAALGRDDPERALALSLASLESSNPAPEAYLTLAVAADAGPRRHFASFARSVTAAAFSPGGDMMIAGDAAGNVHAWDPETGAELRRYTAPGEVSGFAFLPDRTGIAISTFDGHLALLDAVGGTPLAATHPFTGGDRTPINSLAIAADGRTLYTGAESGLVTAWDVARRQALGAVDMRRGDPVAEIALTPGGRLMVLFRSGVLHILDLRADEPAALREVLLLEHDDDDDNTDRLLRCQAWSMEPAPDGRHLLVGCDDGQIQRWDLVDRKLDATYPGHDSTVLSIAFAPGGSYFVSASYDQTVRLWDYARIAELRRYVGHNGEANVAAVSPDGRFVLTGAFDGTARQWDLRGGQVILDLSPASGPVDAAAEARFSPDGARVTTAASGGAAAQWSAQTGQRLSSTSLGGPLYALSADGGLALTGLDAELLVLDLAEGAIVGAIPGEPRARQLWAAFSPDARHVLLSFDALPLRLHRIADGALIRQFPADNGQGGALAIAFSPDGRRVLTGTTNYNQPVARLWDVATGRLVARLEGHRDEVTSVLFSPDGRYAVTGSWDRTVRLWDLGTFRVKQIFLGHSRSLRALALSPNGKLLLTGAEDNTARLWEVATGRELGRLTGHAGDVMGVAFSPDGRTALTASSRGEVLLWRAQVGVGLAKWARANRFVPTLGCKELRRYMLACAAS